MNEHWKSVVGYEGYYEVSDIGRIRRIKAAQGTHPGRIVKPKLNDRGYLEICLSKNARTRWFYVHKLVALAFVLRPSKDLEINHKNLNRLDNRPANLEWLTHAENMKHAVEHGAFKDRPLTAKGEDNPNAKFTAQDIKEIRRLYEKGDSSQTELAQRYSVGRSAIWNIVHRHTWKHISSP